MAAPTVTTQAVSGILATVATGNGNVTADGGNTITERGMVVGTSPNPTTSDSKFSVSGTTGVYVAVISSLTGETIYYCRAYAINSSGTSYGADVSFKTNSALTNLPYHVMTMTNKTLSTASSMSNLSED